MLKNVVIAKFPDENLSITKKRVKDGEVPSDDWAIYGAQVKYRTDSYNEAEKYIARLKEKLIKKPNGSGAVNNGDTLSKLSKNLQRSKRNQSNRSVNKPQLSEAPSNYSIEPVSESLAGISTEIETLKIQTNRVETFNTANEVIKQTDASSESLYGEQLLSNTEHYLHKNTGKQKNNDKKLNNVDSIENDNGPKGIAGNETPANHDGTQLANESWDTTIISEPISDTGNPGQVNFEEGISLLLDHMRDGYFQCCKSLEKLMDNINNQYYCGSYTPFNPTIKDAVAPVVEENEHEEKKNEKQRQVLKRTQTKIGNIKRREIERNEQEIDNSADNDDGDDDYKDDDDDDYDHDDDDDYVKRKRFQSRTLTLPSEYDQNDSKWTLRYREYAPGLVELIEHTGVYINAVKLMNCKRLAKNSKTLARLLLVEIFTESALCTCSLTGVRAKAFDIDGTHVRPGLDENARTVLLTYVEQYAQASKWPKTDNQSILNSIRNKMQEIRVKCNK